ncbi:MAG: TRASH domain-containing protein [Verrucomicrobia bacterium]|nr:TRASH domain-containing protein [Verrucomicrobiota bacterium]
MKPFQIILGAGVLSAMLVAPVSSWAGTPAHKHPQQAEKLTPYRLKTCVVSGDKLGGDMGEPYVHKYQGREIKFCCKSCLKDFNNAPDKYVKAIAEAERKLAK